MIHRASALASSATNLAGSVFSRIKGPAFNPLATSNVDAAEDTNAVRASAEPSTAPSPESEPPIEVGDKPLDGAAVSSSDEISGTGGTPEEDEWVQAGSEINGAVDGMNMFSIEDEDDRNL